MKIHDLTLPINRHMDGIPGLGLYDENPTRCVVLSAVNDTQLASILAKGLEVESDENQYEVVHADVLVIDDGPCLV